MAKVSRSAEEARDLLFLRESDGVTMNRDRLLADAKAKVLELALPTSLHRNPVSACRPIRAGGAEIFVGEFVNAGKATAHDAVVSGQIAAVLTGGDTDITEESPRSVSWSSSAMASSPSSTNRRVWPRGAHARDRQTVEELRP